ncbi:hypothetical protein L7F22_049841 [Adiantum nelumboides]|nr:hypothetical protein [Adiantum nelumboides]
MRSLVHLHRHLWFSSRKLAEKYISHAKHLLSSQDPADVHSALSLLDAALKLFPHWDKALELKARALLCLRRFKDVANMLHDFIPSFKEQALTFENPIEKQKLLSEHPSDAAFDDPSFKSKGLLQYLPAFKVVVNSNELVDIRAIDGQYCCNSQIAPSSTPPVRRRRKPIIWTRRKRIIWTTWRILLQIVHGELHQAKTSAQSSPSARTNGKNSTGGIRVLTEHLVHMEIEGGENDRENEEKEPKDDDYNVMFKKKNDDDEDNDINKAAEGLLGLGPLVQRSVEKQGWICPLKAPK